MKRIGQSQAAQNLAAQGQARPWQAPPPQPYQPYQAARDEPEPDAPGSLFRPRRGAVQAAADPGGMESPQLHAAG